MSVDVPYIIESEGKAMNKPLSVLVAETKTELVGAINNALTKSHPEIVEPILKELYAEVVKLKNDTAKAEKDNYDKSLEEERAREEKVVETLSNYSCNDDSEVVE